MSADGSATDLSSPPSFQWTAGTTVKVGFIIACLIIVAITYRHYPYHGYSFAPSHFRISRYNTITTAADLGRYPTDSPRASIGNLAISTLDAWGAILHHPVLLAILGADGKDARYWYFRNVITAPILIGCGLAVISNRRHVHPLFKAFVFVLPWFFGLKLIGRTPTALLGWAASIGFFVWCITGLVQIERGKPIRLWGFVSLFAGILTLAWRHTAGLVLLISMGTLFLGTFVVPLVRTRRIRFISLTIIVIHLFHSALIYPFYAGTIAAGVFAIVTRLGLASSSQTTASMATPGQTGVTVTLLNLLSALDYLIVGGIVLFAGVLATVVVGGYRLAQIRSKLSMTPENLNADIRSVMVIVCMAAGLPIAGVAFFVYKGMGGLVFRLTQYLTVYALVFIPALYAATVQQGTILTPSVNLNQSAILTRLSAVKLHRIATVTVALALVLCVVSPVAYLLGGGPESSSDRLTDSEALGTESANEYIPKESRVTGTYHIAPPLITKHTKVVGFGYKRFSDGELDTILAGLYYDPTANSFSKSFAILEEEYGEIEYVIFSTRAGDSLGVTTRARSMRPAPEGYISRHDSIRETDKVYSNGVVVVLGVE